MKTLNISGQKVADYCTKYDDGTIKVTVPHLLDEPKKLVLNTEMTITSAASKNAKGAISTMIKVSAPYQAFEKDLVTGEWAASKRRSGAPVACHIVLTIPAALAADADAGCPYARKQLVLVNLMLQKHLGALAADLESAEFVDDGAKPPVEGQLLRQDEEFDSSLGSRSLALPRWSVVMCDATRLGRAVKVEETPKEFMDQTATPAVLPTDEDVCLTRAITGKRLITCDTPTYASVAEAVKAV